MPKLNWSVSVQVSGGPNLTITAPSEDVGAIDRITVDINPGETILDLQPGTVGQIRLLIVEASTYAENMTFMLSENTTDWSPAAGIPLKHGPQIYTASTGGLLGIDPKQIKINNGTSDKITISIFVARNAIVPPPSP